MKKRILATFMAAVFTVMQAASAAPAIQANAASTVEVGDVNLLEHSDFEEEDVALDEHTGGSKLGNWSNYMAETKKVKGNAHTGEWAVELGATGCAIEQDEDTLQKGVTYKATVWAKMTNSNTRAYFGIKNYGGSEIKVPLNSTEYKQYEISFTYTGNDLPRVYIWVESANGGTVYADDFELLTDSDLKQVSIENGKITVDYKDSYTGTPSKDDFSVLYTNSLTGSEEKELAITNAKVDGTQIELSFDAITAAPVEQLITADVTYLPKNQTLTVDYTVDANGEEVVVADVASFTAENGTATVVLDKAPTMAPVKGDFALAKSVNDGDYADVTVTGMNYDAETLTATLSFGITNATTEIQEITLKLSYNSKEYTSDFTVELGNGTVYYVDATDGNDNNTGKSPEAAWKTLDKVNSIEFQPGDKILFEKGETWTGALKPQGSGVKGAPIVIASYGEGDKPVLKPGANWTIPYFQPGAPGPNGVEYNPTVNNGITFYNQEYWEVRDLELYDPTYANTTNPWVYRRGINITAEDCGDLHYFLFDNLTIHGFRGPTDNAGKSSGGIITTVISDPYNRNNRVPSAIHDLTVTNCEMYDLGRSGFNFVSPWTNRTESEWGAFDYTGYGEWKPNTNIYIANNTIYNIDGDGILIDGCKDVLVEHNVVYRAVLNCWYGVGMFNWNSDNTIFQFNEIYDTFPSDSLLGAGDAQGIEIDALNRDTWVQYNYVHDNSGGCIMWCNTNTLRGFRGIYRYNIFQNDLTKHGVIDWRTNHKESMAYNNVFYFGELPEGADARVFMGENAYCNGKSEAKFYNNIFYNLDDFVIYNFNEQEIDWESNIFYGFDKVPTNDSTIITEDPKFVDPGKGTFGLDSVTGYKLQADSPAINAGLNIEDNGGRDYFGTKLTDGKTDIGAAEYTSDDVVVTPEPTVEPTTEPTTAPTTAPTTEPTTEPTVEPTTAPTTEPTQTPEDKKSVTEIFTDVYDDWYTDYVQYVYDNGLMTGIKGTTEFQPNANITKAQVAQVLYNMEGQPAVEDGKVFEELSDVYEGEWYAAAVAWAYETGVVTGDLKAMKFFPNADVTREQLALMMFRYAEFKEYDTSATTDFAGLANADKVANWSMDGVKWAVGAGLISGIEKAGVKDLAPQGNASRAQVAAILQRFCENVAAAK